MKNCFILFFIMLVSLSACKSPNPATPPEGEVPIDSLALLRKIAAPPEQCESCHPNHVKEWRASMHNYAFVDPVFFRLNEIGQQRSGNELDQFCVKCHSPFASLLNETPPGFERSQLSPLAQNGVQCDVCHMMDLDRQAANRGKGVAGFILTGERQGPINDPAPNAFHQSTFDRRYIESDFCSGCHDVLNPDGLQIEHTSTEWDNSVYSGQGIECQTCHMPSYAGQAAVGGPQREAVHRHSFIGVDIPLVDFPDRASTIAQVGELLQNAVRLEVETPPAPLGRDDDLEVTVHVFNELTGHNIPSGTIFERQMWIEIVATDAGTGAVLFRSGHFDANGDLLDHHSEQVRNGEVPIDSSLTVFRGTPYKNGRETLFFWEADSIANNTIAAFEQKSVHYTIAKPFASASQIDLSVRLRFRSLPPYLLREIGLANLLDQLIIFDMETFATTITVSPSSAN